MGTLEYVSSQYIAEIDDYTLAHLQVIICNKLRRNERFTLKLSPPNGESGPTKVLWLSASLPLTFTYLHPANRPLNTRWLHLLAEAACSSEGLWVVPEPQPASQNGHRPAQRENALA